MYKKKKMLKILVKLKMAIIQINAIYTSMYLDYYFLYNRLQKIRLLVFIVFKSWF